MSTEKRVILAFALSLIILLYFTPKKPTEPPLPTSPPVSEESTRIRKERAESPPLHTSTATAPKLNASPVEMVPAHQFTLENDHLAITLTSHNAAIHSLLLKQYHVSLAPSAPNVDLAYCKARDCRYPNLQFTINGTIEVPDLNYAVREQTDDSVVFEARYGDLVGVVKKFTLSDLHTLTSTVELANLTATPLYVTTKLNLAIDESLNAASPKHSFFQGPANNTSGTFYANDKMTVINLSKATNEVMPAHPEWFGISTRYFIFAVVPKLATPQSIFATYDPTTESRAHFGATYPERTIPPKGAIDYAFDMYTGPKDISRLRAEGHNLDKAIDLGEWLGPIARPILLLLKKIHAYIPNYGVAIIILTLLVNIILYPITAKQFKSMKGMQALQPEINAIKEKYANDKQKLNMEMMALFKTHKVNPMGGCLPMLLQMPVFFALYRVLYKAIELRHAPFVFWIHDLSIPDPFYISPLLMGGVMFLQQKLTPAMGDPASTKVMRFMPIIFTVFMIKLPSGLVLYILTNSLFSIAKQSFINRSQST